MASTKGQPSVLRGYQHGDSQRPLIHRLFSLLFSSVIRIVAYYGLGITNVLQVADRHEGVLTSFGKYNRNQCRYCRDKWLMCKLEMWLELCINGQYIITFWHHKVWVAADFRTKDAETCRSLQRWKDDMRCRLSMGPITTSTNCTTSLVGFGADGLRVAEWLMKAH